MNTIELLSFVAGVMTAAGPTSQLWKSLRTRDVSDLSVTTFFLVVVYGSLGVLIGVQYQVVSMIFFNGINLLSNTIILFLISRKLLRLYVGGVIFLLGILHIFVPSFLNVLITTQWTEQVGFLYGVIAGATFLPQVIKIHRTRSASSLAMSNLVLMLGGVSLWTVILAMLKNWSLVFWCCVLVGMLIEMTRMKVVLGRADCKIDRPSYS